MAARRSLSLLIAVLALAGGKPTAQGQPFAIGKAMVTTQVPADLVPARNLSSGDRRDNFDALFEAVAATYADFELKHIDWTDVGRRYRSRLDAVRTDDEFYMLLFQLVNELKDTHSWLVNYKIPPILVPAGLTVDLFRGKPYVVAVDARSREAEGVEPGWEVVAVDGMPVAEKVAALQAHLHACSSDRAYQREAARSLLAGERGTTASVTLRSADGLTRTVALPRTALQQNRLPERQVAFELTRQRYVHFGRHPSGLGYIWITSFNGREEIANEFDHALEELRNTPGLILDIRDNTGGYGQARIVGRLLSRRRLTSVAHIRKSGGRKGFDTREVYLGPVGSWQYTRPVALLVNDVTGSAADLFACELRSAGRVITVGSTTHGNLSGTAVYVVLPCGLAARISNAYLADAKDRPIEVNGNVPDVFAEPTIEDFLKGHDPVMDKAVAALSAPKPSRPEGRNLPM